MVSIAYNGYSHVESVELRLDGVDDGFDFFFARVDPTRHGACAVDNDH